MEDLTALISQVGFPIAVSIYLLWERNANIKENTSALGELREAIIELRAGMKG